MATTNNPILECVTTAIDDMKGNDVKVLAVDHLTPMTQYMVICTASSSTHGNAILQNIESQAKQRGLEVLGSEKDAKRQWLLIDLGDVITHVMTQETRDYYDLEKLWDLRPEQK